MYTPFSSIYHHNWLTRSMRRWLVFIIIIFMTSLIILILLPSPRIERDCKPIDYKLKKKDRFYNFTRFVEISKVPTYNWLDQEKLSPRGNIFLQTYNLHFCKLDKNMGSPLMSIMCFLDNPQKYTNFFFSEAWIPAMMVEECGRSVQRGNLRQKLIESVPHFFAKYDVVKHFAVVREPFTRFISAWLDVCACRAFPRKWCYGCRENLHCFIKRNYEHILLHAKGIRPYWWDGEWYFYPQSWFCDFETHKNNYHILYYTKKPWLKKQILKVFTDQGIKKKLLKTINSTLHNRQFDGSVVETSKEIEDWLKEHKSISSILYKTYYSDYEMFKFNK